MRARVAPRRPAGTHRGGGVDESRAECRGRRRCFQALASGHAQRGQRRGPRLSGAGPIDNWRCRRHHRITGPWFVVWCGRMGRGPGPGCAEAVGAGRGPSPGPGPGRVAGALAPRPRRAGRSLGQHRPGPGRRHRRTPGPDRAHRAPSGALPECPVSSAGHPRPSRRREDRAGRPPGIGPAGHPPARSAGAGHRQRQLLEPRHHTAEHLAGRANRPRPPRPSRPRRQGWAESGRRADRGRPGAAHPGRLRRNRLRIAPGRAAPPQHHPGHPDGDHQPGRGIHHRDARHGRADRGRRHRTRRPHRGGPDRLPAPHHGRAPRRNVGPGPGPDARPAARPGTGHAVPGADQPADGVPGPHRLQRHPRPRPCRTARHPPVPHPPRPCRTTCWPRSSRPSTKPTSQAAPDGGGPSTAPTATWPTSPATSTAPVPATWPGGNSATPSPDGTAPSS